MDTFDNWMKVKPPTTREIITHSALTDNEAFFLTEKEYENAIAEASNPITNMRFEVDCDTDLHPGALLWTDPQGLFRFLSRETTETLFEYYCKSDGFNDWCYIIEYFKFPLTSVSAPILLKAIYSFFVANESEAGNLFSGETISDRGGIPTEDTTITDMRFDVHAAIETGALLWYNPGNRFQFLSREITESLYWAYKEAINFECWQNAIDNIMPTKIDSYQLRTEIRRFFIDNESEASSLFPSEGLTEEEYDDFALDKAIASLGKMKADRINDLERKQNSDYNAVADGSIGSTLIESQMSGERIEKNEFSKVRTFEQYLAKNNIKYINPIMESFEKIVDRYACVVRAETASDDEKVGGTRIRTYSLSTSDLVFIPDLITHFFKQLELELPKGDILWIRKYPMLSCVAPECYQLSARLGVSSE